MKQDYLTEQRLINISVVNTELRVQLVLGHVFEVDVDDLKATTQNTEQPQLNVRYLI